MNLVQNHLVETGYVQLEWHSAQKLILQFVLDKINQDSKHWDMATQFLLPYTSFVTDKPKPHPKTFAILSHSI